MTTNSIKTKRAQNQEQLRYRYNNRRAAALLVVLFIVMVATILSLGFLSKSDVEMACGANMVLRAQMDYLAGSGLEHAKGLITGNSDFLDDWQASGQQLVQNSDDYYDVSVTKIGLCDYQITSTAYRKKDGEKIAQSNLKAELRLDPCIAYWTNIDTTISSVTVINGDVYCGSNLTNNGMVNGDVFAVGLSGSGTKSGRLYGTDELTGVSSPDLNIDDFTPTYIPDVNNNVELSTDTVINGTLVVDANLIISNGSVINVIAGENSPAVLITGEVEIKDYSRLIIEGFAQITRGISIESTAAFEISGSLFIVGNGSISGSGNVFITTEPAGASFLLPPETDGTQQKFSPIGGAFFRSVER